MSATLGIGGALGIPVAAWVTEAFTWRIVFYAMAGLAALICCGMWALPKGAAAPGGRLDIVGAALLSAALVVTLVGVSKGHDWGWDTPRPWLTIVAGLLLAAVWTALEWRCTHPLVDIRLCLTRPVLLTNVASISLGFGMMAQGIVATQLLQLPRSAGGFELSMLEAGVVLAPGGLMMLLWAPVSAKLMSRAGARTTVVIGSLVIAAGYVGSTAAFGAAWQVVLVGIVIASGVGISYAAVPTLILAAVPPAAAGSAVGVNALMRSLGTTCAAAVMATVLTSLASSSGVPTRSAFVACYLLGGLAALIAALIVVFVRTTPVRASRGRAPERLLRSGSGPREPQVFAANRS